MEQMTNNEFNIAFQPFLDYFPTADMTKEKLNIYFIALCNLSKEELGKAFISIVKNRVYKGFPQIAEILQYATGTTESELEDRIVIAKRILKNAIIRYGSYGSIEFEDKGIHAAIDALDGWQKVCAMQSEELEKFLTFEFGKIYKAYARNKYEVSRYYMGFYEMSNGTRNINKIGLKDMGRSLEKIDNRVQSLNFNIIKQNMDLEEKSREIKKLDEIIKENKELIK
ncbi:hypothetical protein KSU01_08190 [Fusobacterium animalis]|uniref:DUF6475 domain-containing protein n=1 Tax=Fusobacterium animalis TaxID=76859 RepID=UPI0030D2A9E0